MACVDTTLIKYLGKKVSFSIFNGYETYLNVGVVTDVLISINIGNEIAIDDGDFYSFSDLIDFLVLD
jgi:hypothetical protein